MNTLPAAPERPITFTCEGDTLVGILHAAATGADPAAARTGVVVIVGGPQYRAGSHRQFVHLARALAAAGHPVLRFDVRGMGDSTGPLRPFDAIGADIGAAIDALQHHAPGVARVALWGLCDGASAALLYLDERADPRVAGLCLLNPWVRSEASLARTHVKHYYTRRLRQPEFWAKLLRGRVAWQALSDLLGNLVRARSADIGGAGMQAASLPRSPFQVRMAAAWRRFHGRTLLVLSGEDYTAREFVEFTASDAAWSNLLNRPGVTRHDIAGADHTLSRSADRQMMNSVTLRWLEGLTRG